MTGGRGVHGRGACMAGGVHAGRACMAGGMCGRGACVVGEHEMRLVNVRVVHILLECILVLDGHSLSDNFFPIFIHFSGKKLAK